MSVSEVQKAIRTIKAMLVSRGHELGDLEGVDNTEIEQLATTKDVFFLPAAAKDVVVILRKLKNSDIVKAAAAVEEGRRQEVILVSRDKLTGVNVKCLHENFGRRAEHFHLQDLQIDIAKHVLVPRHTIMPKSEVDALLKELMIKSKLQLPSILETDAMARYIGARPGDVVRIERPSPTAGETLFYRHCV
jgi:DNA-directed RNA polymerase subunit H (RpoH/RPB5)